MGAVLGGGETGHPDHQHVRVVVVAGVLRRGVQGLVEVGQHVGPGGRVAEEDDVVAGPPHGGHAGTPVPGVLLAPVADGQRQGPAGGGRRLRDGVADGLVAAPGVEPLDVAAAPVDLDEVEAPGGELQHVLGVVALAARVRRRRTAGREVVAAAVLARVGVDARLEALAVDVVGDGAHSAGPLGGVDRDVARAVAGALPPAFVDVDVLVPGRRQAGRHEGVHLRLDHVVVDLGGETVPRRPAHRSRWYGHLVRRHRGRFRAGEIGVRPVGNTDERADRGRREHHDPDKGVPAEAPRSHPNDQGEHLPFRWTRRVGTASTSRLRNRLRGMNVNAHKSADDALMHLRG